MSKRNLFDEMMQGVDEMAAQREGKITLRQVKVESRPAPEVTANDIVALRKKMKMSQKVFAMRVRTSVETLRNWEQDKAKPNAQAALLIKLVEQYPDMVDRLAKV
ncbi:helix-turn-helix domain-containing protein [Pseudomonas neustonica]|uniref:Helix-turn-helix domain-containing protein n=2 Tax=Pseudomonas TaxID=286 RepID=A0ABX9XF70_9PSED|nr:MULTISPECIES: helix-turn-helix domain-containing protein [Pseudomonas]MAB25784.1 transcriptional regulator [Pseudomonadales bacterium]ROZ81047.1 helix-turn-helix domain-containing protein [Pseudomonas sp. SSM44]ROZ82277.1 helix-turn-helix domain-containing protein [Pseudomonas neustonica]|tara:strand:+ start:183 stop:497 length:315 start_codon:yes stop_codon:yes gene_type:complete